MKKIKCIVCGRDLEIDKNKDVICKSCKMKSEKYEKETTHITLCKLCFRYKKGGKWYTPKEVQESITKYISYIFNIPEEEIEEIKGYTYQYVDHESKTINEIHIGFGVCDECSRQIGGYYESIIQIRGDKNFVEKITTRVVQFVESSNMPRAFITKIEKTRGGKDIYLGSKSIGKKFIKSLDKKQYILKRSSSFYGVKDGKKITRDVFLIRQKKGD